MKPKSLISGLLITSSAILFLGINYTLENKQAQATSIFPLYDDSSNLLPQQRTPLELTYGQAPPTPPIATQSATAGVGVTLNTVISADNTGYSGYTNYGYSGGLIRLNPSYSLDKSAGYTLNFNVALTTLNSTSPNRAGFSVTLTSSDALNGIEIAFQSGGLIFAQDPNFDNKNEFTTYNDMSSFTNYAIKVLNNNYTLSINGTDSLSGSLRQYNYNATDTVPLLPFNPYRTADFIFLGDKSNQGSSTFTLKSASLDASAVPFEFSPELGLLILGSYWGFQKIHSLKTRK